MMKLDWHERRRTASRQSEVGRGCDNEKDEWWKSEQKGGVRCRQGSQVSCCLGASGSMTTVDGHAVARCMAMGIGAIIECTRATARLRSHENEHVPSFASSHLTHCGSDCCFLPPSSILSYMLRRTLPRELAI